MSLHARPRPIAPDSRVGPIRARDALDPLFEGRRLHRLRGGGALFVEGDERAGVYRITEGFALRTRHLASGARQVVGFGEPGDVIGFRRWGDRHGETALAAREVAYQIASLETVTARLHADPGLALALLENQSAQARRVEDLFVLRAKQPSHVMLAGFLIRLHAFLGADPEGVLHLPLSRTDIADHLGFSPETASRAFTRLRELGLAAPIGRRDVRILDADRLARLGGDAPAEAEARLPFGWDGSAATRAMSAGDRPV